MSLMIYFELDLIIEEYINLNKKADNYTSSTFVIRQFIGLGSSFRYSSCPLTLSFIICINV